ncbi:putative membrane protein YccC [Kitasatospora sp. SolWspMP-SS2h]|uniref:FUSC family protein n=1 Tax=Kitasatospora sp. SolWspMP-SS2h TaxID=1305729 RepID=UPI000DB97A2F|nr:FUSC family protein [Kitasatospora sp. SolWspMP-SS2h]RAJ37586.1 putative membrane protein YccC [Kitasatospora sp. SolWspMP-SS2h]
MSWFTALRDTARAGLTVDRSLTNPRRALRGAVAAALVVFPALFLYGPAQATSAAMGAFIAGTATFQRSFRPRASLALAAAAGLGLSTFLGYVAVGIPGAFPVVLALWAFGAGLAWAIGPTAGVVAANTLAVMMVVVQLPVSVPTAVEHGLLCSVGGAVQALVVTVWPIDSWRAQRDALADIYAGLGDYARRLRHDPVAQVDPEPFIVGRQAARLTARQARRRPPELRGLRTIAERIRPALAALADPRVGAAEEGAERDRAREVLAAAADVLDALARAIRSGDPVRLPRDTPGLALARPGSGEDLLRGAARRSARRLSGLLGRAADRLDRQDRTTVQSRTAPTATATGLRRPPLVKVAPAALATVGRQLHRHSAIFHHAVRMAVVVTSAYLASRLLRIEHGYWAPMTSAMVMRPDFAQTFSRGVARVAGTAAGVLLSTAVVQLFDPGDWVLAVLAVCCMGLAYLTMRTGYAVMTVAISSYVVFLLGLQPGDPVRLAVDRVSMTLLGGFVALAAYALFPTWQTARLPERLAEWLASAGRYAAAVFGAYGDPAGGRAEREVRPALLDVREARSEMLAALDRAEVEPVRHSEQVPELSRKQFDKARSAVGMLDRSTVLLEAHLPGEDAPPVPGAGAFGEELRDATALAAAAVLLGQDVDFTLLREAHRTWDHQLAALPPDDRIDVVRAGARLVMQALTELERAVRTRPQPAHPEPVPLGA